MKCWFEIYGCHDVTEFEMELDDKETEVARKICKASENASNYSCQPVIQMSLMVEV